MGWPSFSPPRKPNFCTGLILSLVREGNEWAGPLISKDYMYIHDGEVDAFTCQGGKIMDQPSFSPPR